MPIPNLTIEQVQNIIRQASNIQPIGRGGQKSVYSAIIDGHKYAIKFLKLDIPDNIDSDEEYIDVVKLRAQREVETMEQCASPYLVKMGPIGLTTAKLANQNLIYFTEEFIEGKNLDAYKAEIGVLKIEELISLSLDISDAINAIWQFSKIHRDIKPKNIMRRDSNGEFVLLDMGLVFDLQDESFSILPVGTPQYFSPEQIDFTNRRTVMNFRSDLFSLGIVLYEMATNKHPFITDSSRTHNDVINNILNMNPEPQIVRTY